MSETHSDERRRETVYVPGSGLIAIPYHRLHEIPLLRSEYHADEAKRAMMLARYRKPA